MSTTLPTPKHRPGLTWLGTMTEDEFAALPENPYKAELLDGEAYMAAAPRLDHQDFAFRFGIVIHLWVEQHSLGRVSLSNEVRLSASWTFCPDVVFLSTGRFAQRIGTRSDGPVDLAVEVLSPSTEHVDRGDKFLQYAHFGVSWYWIVDLDTQTLEEYENVNGSFVLTQTVPFATLFSPRLFPGLSIDLAVCL